MTPIFNPHTYLHQPYEVSLETLAQCNAACEFCTYPSLERIGTSMSNELIARLVDEFATFEQPFFFSPFKVNEPFLDKRTIGLCQLMNLRVPLARLRLFTNGTPLTTKLIIDIARLTNVEHLWVSLNSVDEVEYEKIMRLPFKLTRQRLDVLHDAVEDGPMQHTVIVSRVAGTFEENDRFMHYCGFNWPRFTPVIIKRDGWLGDIDAPAVMIPNSPCSRWWELSITATGVVSLCCMDGHAKFAIGDVSKTSMLAVYNDPAYKERREKLLLRKAIWPCATCSY